MNTPSIQEARQYAKDDLEVALSYGTGSEAWVYHVCEYLYWMNLANDLIADELFDGTNDLHKRVIVQRLCMGLM